MKMLRNILLVSLTAIAACCFAQSDDAKKAEEQRRIIANLEKSIAQEEQQLASLKKDKASAQKRVRLLTAQIEKRSALISATSRRIDALTAEVKASSRRIEELSGQLSALEASCGEMIRAAYRNYRYNTVWAYVLSSDSFAETARRIAALRTATERRGEQMREITSLREDVRREREVLDKKREELAASKRKLDKQRERMRADAKTARQTVSLMSKKEQEVLRTKTAQEQQLEKAVAQLRRLTKGNKSGASFSSQTRGLHLPVAGGRVRRYNGNMAEIVGSEGARITAIYEGKVVDVKRNKVNNKYDIYIAHGEYISSYANLSAVNVTKGQTVARDQRIGTIGASVNLTTMEIEYKLVFGIYAPSPSVKMSAANCFKK
ncbi:MAG: murein hydrolase activator EnvC family protein [Alistipes sp.]